MTPEAGGEAREADGAFSRAWRGFRVPLRMQLIVGFALLSGAGFAYLAHALMTDMRPRYLEAMEDGLVDDARLFAAMLERNMDGDSLNVSGLDTVFRNARARPFKAVINGVSKTEMSLRLYVTDARGVVRFDSEGLDEGKDFSRWNDVYLTLRGRYGARSTRLDASDEGSSVKYVAAPILLRDGRIAGVVAVGKPSRAVNEFLREARVEIATAGLLAALLVAAVGWMLSSWVTRPVRRLTAFARAVRDGRDPGPAPTAGRSELHELGVAFGEMREALEGRKYVESYVQSLAHALKSPLASVQGSAELLQEDLPPETRARFAENVLVECRRMDRLVGRMLELAALESRHALEKAQAVEGAAWVREVTTEFQPLAEQRGLALTAEVAPETGDLEADAFLLRQALGSLIENALEFSPAGGAVRVTAGGDADAVTVTVEDAGPGIPDYAGERVFEKFFSLPRPGNGRKSTGLGLSWVKEVTRLHGGSLALANRPEGGLRVTWTLPRRRAA